MMPFATKPTTTSRHRARRARRPVAVAAASALLLGLLGLGVAGGASAATQGVFDAADVPTRVTDDDTSPVELGMRFETDVAGAVSGIRFYKGPRNTGAHVGTLWSQNGEALASVAFTNETASGWQTAALPTPVQLAAGEIYTVSYLAPNGRYAADEEYFTADVTSGPITVHAGGGVYSYAGGLPTSSYRGSNYYVDVLFTPAGTAPESPTEPTPPTPTPTPTPDPTTPAPDPNAPTLNLPLIPWEGGPAYYEQFERADAAGWSDPGFFPIAVTFNNLITDADADYDKALGINTYTGMYEGVPYSMFEDNDVFWVGDQLNRTFTQTSRNWVGDYLDDEVDGRYAPQAGFRYLQSLVDGYGDDGRFKYANYTHMVISDLGQADSEQFVNGYTDVVSLDRYFYTLPFCDWTPFRGDSFVTPIEQGNCRTSSTYGKTMDSLRVRDAADGDLQTLWQFVEVYNGGGTQDRVAEPPITPGQLQGAVMSSLINEARGIIYFNQSMNGPCISGELIRMVQKNPDFCAAQQVASMGVINNRIKELAPVLNTQSFVWSAGAGTDTMVKAYDGYAYIFAMVDGSSAPGSRTLTLPPGVSGTDVEVLWENRTIPAGSGAFTDSFPAEYSYHVYKVKI
jgi:hypothetical protein